MPRMTQLTVSCENRPGTLAEITGILGKAKVNILAFSASSAGAMGYVQLIVNNTNRAKKALNAQGISCYEEQVLHVTLPNVPGALSRFASKQRWKTGREPVWCSLFLIWRVPTGSVRAPPVG